mmetsp:Transcript_25680/g.35464  ORF Transcript_25680/g.35464 Transcript_25680/m.35464 type:complete len:109 (-) Transcript_25680:122-448(-)|eukprot:CAMPEP_0196588034 /NCGR_PEP_ID=MMETSP1081-20130531/59370_1 /TAXON_ID=36882 /ORGANISM="Pyramimonas amylifera, Strain CCMP720" /LENGTH=108 /DNA_ID=CAMNT_0041910411 /DNA_START=356 /DNA_END=682 /DNA_ORIENTATION=+
MPSNSSTFPDATGLHKTKSPFGDFTLTSLATGEIMKCPMTGSHLKNSHTDKKDTYVIESSVKNEMLRSKKFYVDGEVDILIHNLRNTNFCNLNTNESRVGTFKKDRKI